MPHILTINAGSSSVRYELFSIGPRPRRLFGGKTERLGSEDAGTSAQRLVQQVNERRPAMHPDAIGHRVVHGMLHTEPERVSPELLQELRQIAAFDPEHLPREIELIEKMQRHYPRAPQVACFDPAFHGGMPAVSARTSHRCGSAFTGRVAVRVIRTDEESVIAELSARLLGMATEE